MLSDSAISALRDIEHNIALAGDFIEGLEFETFRDDTRTLYAVTRCLEINSEASRRLPDELKMHPSIAWRDMAGAGNIYRHEYEDIVAKLIWDTVQVALPPLSGVVSGELEAIGK
jgi:uncharacterized protein with HEPN domain